MKKVFVCDVCFWAVDVLISIFPITVTVSEKASINGYKSIMMSRHTSVENVVSKRE